MNILIILVLVFKGDSSLASFSLWSSFATRVTRKNESARSCKIDWRCPLTLSRIVDSHDPSGPNNGLRSQLGSHGSYMNACVYWLKQSAIGPTRHGHVVQPRSVRGRWLVVADRWRMLFRSLSFLLPYLCYK